MTLMQSKKKLEKLVQLVVISTGKNKKGRMTL